MPVGGAGEKLNRWGGDQASGVGRLEQQRPPQRIGCEIQSQQRRAGALLESLGDDEIDGSMSDRADDAGGG